MIHSHANVLCQIVVNLCFSTLSGRDPGCRKLGYAMLTGLLL
jgi:hypothetical protein